jgi:hypothetical protein
MPRTSSFLVCLPLFALAMPGQQTVTGPAPYANAEANNSSGLPWNNGATSALRVQYVYDSSIFTGQNVNFPMVITRLRWRADGALTCTGGTMAGVTIVMATATVDHLQMSTTFAANLGQDQLQVFNGSVNVTAATGTTPNDWYADVTLAVPFVYDPTSGNDLAIDIGVPPNAWTGGTTCRQDLELTTGVTLGSRIYDLTNNLATVGTFTVNQSAVIEFTYMAPTGAATVQPYGIGCNPATPLDLNAAARPILNTTANLVVDTIPAGTLGGVMVLSLTQHNPGLSAAAHGMPNCFQYVGLDVTSFLVVSGATATYPLMVPNLSQLVGVHVYTQAAMFAAGSNPLGIVSSNGLDLGVGN